jgi:hypothetical protein
MRQYLRLVRVSGVYGEAVARRGEAFAGYFNEAVGCGVRDGDGDGCGRWLC